MKNVMLTSMALLFFVASYAQTGEEIIKRVDKNISAENTVSEITMIIHGKRNQRTLKAKSYTVGNEKSFTEYLYPAGSKGTKMLKLGNSLWIYSPSTDRTIQISGHMLRQSVMGSDLSYEDMMEDRKLLDVYNVKLQGKDTMNGRNCYVLELTAKITDVAYYSRRIWIDTERYVSMKQELYAKSGQLLKVFTFSDFKKIDSRWYPMKINFKDALKQGDGTDYIINSIKFNQQIPDYIFSKAALKQ